MKIQRQRVKAEQEGLINGNETQKNGPDAEKVKVIMCLLNYVLIF